MAKKKVAIFDIDGTIFRSSLLIELVDALIQEEIFSPKVAKVYEKAYRKWIERKGSYDDYIMSVVRAYDSNIIGVKQKDLKRAARKVGNFHKNIVYRYTRDLIAELKKKKYYLLAISHSPKIIVDEFVGKFGFDKAYGLLHEIDKNNRFGKDILFRDLIFNKDKILRRAVEKENLTLRGSVGVGDTDKDIPFLKMVAKPICFNPNSKLYRHAKQAGWRIVVERKDVIYKL